MYVNPHCSFKPAWKPPLTDSKALPRLRKFPKLSQATLVLLLKQKPTSSMKTQHDNLNLRTLLFFFCYSKALVKLIWVLNSFLGYCFATRLTQGLEQLALAPRGGKPLRSLTRDFQAASGLWGDEPWEGGGTSFRLTAFPAPRVPNWAFFQHPFLHETAPFTERNLFFLSFLLYHVLCSSAFLCVPEASQNTEGRKEASRLGWVVAPSLSGSCHLRGEMEGVNNVGLVLKLGGPGWECLGFQ